MNVFLLYLYLLKATITSFSGLSSLPIVHADLVEHHRVLTGQQLNTAVAAANSGPGPRGIYTVSVGYLAAGVPGAIAGYFAMITPAFLVIPLLRLFSRHASNPGLRRSIRAILLSAAGLLISSSLQLGEASITGAFTAVIAVASFAVLAFTKVETLLVICGAALIGAVSVIL